MNKKKLSKPPWLGLNIFVKTEKYIKTPAKIRKNIKFTIHFGGQEKKASTASR